MTRHLAILSVIVLAATTASANRSTRASSHFRDASRKGRRRQSLARQMRGHNPRAARYMGSARSAAKCGCVTAIHAYRVCSGARIAVVETSRAQCSPGDQSNSAASATPSMVFSERGTSGYPAPMLGCLTCIVQFATTSSIAGCAQFVWRAHRTSMRSPERAPLGLRFGAIPPNRLPEAWKVPWTVRLLNRSGQKAAQFRPDRSARVR